MTRRGLTLLETLLALAALSLLIVAAAGWLSGGVRLAVEAGERQRWNAAAEAALRLVAEDLGRAAPPIAADDIGDAPDRLTVPTRSVRLVEGRPVIDERAVYRLDAVSGELWRAAPGEAEERLLLGGVRAIAVTFEGDADDPFGFDPGPEVEAAAAGPISAMRVELVGSGGRRRSRAFAAPWFDPRWFAASGPAGVGGDGP